MKNCICYLCGNKRLKTIVNLDWPIKKCLHCNLIQVSPLPALSAVNQLYQGNYWKNFSFYSSQIPAHEKYFRKKIADIKKLRKSGRLLDVGCAYGTLIKEANDQGFMAEGIDISGFAVKQCKKINLKANTGVITDVKKKNYYDVITAFEVVEHERNPLLTIKTAYQLLKIDGLLVVSVPDSNSLSSKIMGKYWFGYRHKEHLFHFTKNSLNALLCNGGFSDIVMKKDIARAYLFTYYLERINFYLFKSKLLSKIIFSLKKVPVINNLTIPLNPWGNIIAYAVKKITELIKKHYLFIIFLSLVVVLVFLTYKNYGITWDEVYYVNVGRYYVIQIFDALKIPHNLVNNNFAPTELHLKTHGVFFDVLVILLTPLFQKFNMEIYHLIKALISLISFLLLYLILLKFVPKKWALFGMFLLLLFPRFYGDIFNNSIDIPTLMFFAIYVALFLHFSDKENSLPRLILLSLSLAILINQRIVFLYVFLLTCIFLIKKPKLIFILSIFTFIFLHLTHPYLWQHPIVGFFNVLRTSNSFPFTAGNLFNGQFIMSNQLPWDYVPRLIAITTPLSTLGLFFIGNFYLIYLILNKKTSNDLKKKYIYLLSLFYIPLIIIVVVRPALYDSWRHFLFLTIPLIIIAVFCAYAISKIKNNLIKVILFGLITVNLLQTAVEMKALHPYQYIYYNSLVGGLKGADGKYETDYWGASYKEAVEWFNRNINDPNKIYYFSTQGDPLSISYYFKKNMFLTDDFNKVNYAISFTRWNSDQKYTGKTVHKVEREGVPLVYIKEFP